MSTIIRGFQIGQSNTITTNKIIKNTYMLLSMTLIFSSLTAYISSLLKTQHLGFAITFIIYIPLLFMVHISRNSIWGIISIFMFTGFMGYTIGPMLNIILYGFSNGSQLIMMSLGLTGFIFIVLSAYVMITQKNFKFLSGFLFIGLLIILTSCIINLFFQLPIIQITISGILVLISSGYILYQTSEIIHGGERNYILATINLYIQIFNLFVSLLHIITLFTGRRD